MSSNLPLERWGPVALLAIGILIAMLFNGWPPAEYVGSPEKIATLLGSLFVVALLLERSLAVINDLAIPKAEAESFVLRAAEVLSSTKLDVIAAGRDAIDKVELASANLLTATETYEAALQNEQKVNDKRARLRLGVGFLAAVLITTLGLRTLGTLLALPTIPGSTPAVVASQTAAPAPAPAPAPARAPAPAQPQRRVAAPAGGEPGAANTAPAVVNAAAPAAEAERQGQAAGADAGRGEPPKSAAQKSSERRAWLFSFLDILFTAGLLAGGSNGLARLIEVIRGKPNTGSDRAGLISMSDLITSRLKRL